MSTETQPAETLPAYRIRFAIDADYVPDGCDGRRLPEARAVYEANVITPNGGPAISYEEYCQYYGNPDRHVGLEAYVERQCACCQAWATVASLHGIDVMDDDPAYLAVQLDRTYAIADAEKLPGYLADVTKELMREAKHA